MKNRNSWSFYKCFYVLVQDIITNEVRVAILQAYIRIPQQIRKGELIRQIIESHFCKAVAGQQFSEESRKLHARINLCTVFPVFGVHNGPEPVNNTGNLVEN